MRRRKECVEGLTRCETRLARLVLYCAVLVLCSVASAHASGDRGPGSDAARSSASSQAAAAVVDPAAKTQLAKALKAFDRYFRSTSPCEIDPESRARIEQAGRELDARGQGALNGEEFYVVAAAATLAREKNRPSVLWYKAATTSPVSDLTSARAFNNFSVFVAKQGLTPDLAIAATKNAPNRFGDSKNPDVRLEVAWALAYRAALLAQMKKPEEALESLNDLLKRFPDEDDLAMKRFLARTMLEKAEILSDLGCETQMRDTLAALVERFGASDDREISVFVIQALFSQGRLAAEQGDLSKGGGLLDQAIQHARAAGFDRNAELGFARLLSFKMEILQEGHRYDEALKVYEDLNRRLSPSENPEVRPMLAMALYNSAFFLRELGRSKDVMARLEALDKRFGDSPDPRVRAVVARGMLNRGYMFADMGEPGNSLAALDEIVARFGADKDPAVREWVGMALYSKGMALDKAGEPEQALRAFERCRHILAGYDQKYLRRLTCETLTKAADVADRLGKKAEARAYLDAMVKDFGDSHDPEIQRLVEKAKASLTSS